MFKKNNKTSPSQEFSSAYKISGDGVAVLKPEELKRDPKFKEYIKAMSNRKIAKMA